MKRGTPLRQVSDKRAAENREREKAKTVVRQRARGGCEARTAIASVTGISECSGPFDFHEVLTRARGGSITDPENILMVCRRHHDWITENPLSAAGLGLVRNSWDAPRRSAPATPSTGLRAANVRPTVIPRPRPVSPAPAPDSAPTAQSGTMIHTFVWPQRPWTVNGERKMTSYGRAAKVKEWREAFKVLGVGSVPLEWAEAVVRVYLRDLRDQDPGAAFPAYKAALDGLVDARILPDDDGRYVRKVTFYPPEKSTFDALEVILMGPVA